MSIKKILSTLAGLALVSGALLGVSSPTYAEDALPVAGEVEAPTDLPAPPEDPTPVTAEDPPDPEPLAEATPTFRVSPVQSQPLTQTPSSAGDSARNTAPASGSRPDDDKKAWVCKFVASKHSPSGYVLKSGKQPIEVSVNALGPDVNDTGTFNDRQPSFVVPSDDDTLCSRTEVIVEHDVVCPTNDNPGIVNVTTTITLYYGSTIAEVTVEQSTRALTVDEARECAPEEWGIATAVVSFSDATCVAAQQVILGVVTNAVWGEIIMPEAGDYMVTATADDGFKFAGGLASLTFTGTLADQLDPLSEECDLETLALVMPSVTFTQATCADGGFYALGAEASYDPALLTFTVNGTPGVTSGTYEVTASGLVLVTAHVEVPHGFEEGWVDPPAYLFEVPSEADCVTPIDVQLPTLAFTGSAGTPQHGWWLAGVLIALGVSAVYGRRWLESETL